jgi:hypothetical protein
MKNFALVIAFALLATVPASAAEISKAAPAMTPEQQTQEAIPLGAGIQPEIIQPVPRCYTLDGNSCSNPWETRACTDACQNQLHCTCEPYYGGPYYNTIIGYYWRCDWEC